MNEGNQRAFVAQLIDPERKATGYGIYHTVVGIIGLPGGIIIGVLYQSLGSGVVFFYSACLCLLVGIIFYFSMMRR
jgi:MFS-type transporter involved in bile tolerance (Atg22 family)